MVCGIHGQAVANELPIVNIRFATSELPKSSNSSYLFFFGGYYE
jgi:hypothetical protein